MTPREFYLAIKHRGEMDSENTENIVRVISESIRMSTLTIRNALISRKQDHVSRPEKLWGFPWDKKIKGEEPQTLEAMKSILSALRNSRVGGTGKKASDPPRQGRQRIKNKT